MTHTVKRGGNIRENCQGSWNNPIPTARSKPSIQRQPEYHSRWRCPDYPRGRLANEHPNDDFSISICGKTCVSSPGTA